MRTGCSWDLSVRQCQGLVSPRWRIKGQANESRVAHQAQEGKTWTIPQHCKCRSASDKTRSLKVHIRCTDLDKSGAVVALGGLYFAPSPAPRAEIPNQTVCHEQRAPRCTVSFGQREPPGSPAQWGADKISKAGTSAKITTNPLEIFD